MALGGSPGHVYGNTLKNELALDSQFFCGNLCDVRVTEAKMRFHHLGGGDDATSCSERGYRIRMADAMRHLGVEVI
jgi:hypothetical protein